MHPAHTRCSHSPDATLRFLGQSVASAAGVLVWRLSVCVLSCTLASRINPLNYYVGLRFSPRSVRAHCSQCDTYTFCVRPEGAQRWQTSRARSGGVRAVASRVLPVLRVISRPWRQGVALARASGACSKITFFCPSHSHTQKWHDNNDLAHILART